ncbi:GH39 family glycosyl hydrolase [Goodfellowiella coeruleoviolacea]|uniref:Xylan 1,4-beta-xylosidase n=1 Tax=Goodfellowiella coeruleoviolacea TaxID=334858 RepID=A0AAE3GC14_9PSEU|nr:glycosyl hydrolase [Goodfellowiella coeruleoviolacea]MCP2163393.1 xylan 1,4-beta-xylosidase [Goodfellowiella coeruleoviolacea]
MDVVVPDGGDGRRLSEAWRYCVGTGRLALALRQDYLDSLAVVQAEIGFRYLRGHGLLSDDVGIYREYEWQGSTRVLYNFTYLDQILDSLLGLGIRPFLELGFMPSQLASGEQTVFWWRGNVTPPKDYDRWNDLVRAVLTHCVERYGRDEVVSWPVEVWNEPNLVNFWQGADQAEYFRLYRETARTVKEVDPRFQVGGPAICGGTDHWLTDFLVMCREQGVPVDFLSRHAYSSGPAQPVPFGCYQTVEPPRYLLDQFATGRAHAVACGYPDLPVHITEFNTSYKPVNPVHDTAWNAAYVASVLAEGGDHVDSFSYWTFCDVFEEEDVPTALFHGGFGLLAHRQVPKPTFHLYRFFARLGAEVLHRDEHTLVTRHADGRLAVLAWHRVDDGATETTREVGLSLPAPTGPLFAKHSLVDEEHGNAWQVWRSLGRPRFPTEAQLELITSCARPAVRTEVLTPVEDRAALRFTLGRNQVRLVELHPVHDETGDYPGLDDTRIPGYGDRS